MMLQAGKMFNLNSSNLISQNRTVKKWKHIGLTLKILLHFYISKYLIKFCTTTHTEGNVHMALYTPTVMTSSNCLYSHISLMNDVVGETNAQAYLTYIRIYHRHKYNQNHTKTL